MNRRFLVVAQIGFAFAAIAHADNLIENGDFSGDMAPWEVAGGSYQVCGGTYPGANTCAVSNGNVLQWVTGLSASDTYTLTFWTNESESTSDSIMGLAFANNYLTWGSSSSDFALLGTDETSGYSEYTATFTNIEGGDLQFYAKQFGSTPLYLTGVDLEDTSATPEPGTLCMSGLGAILLSLGLKRVRKSA